MYLLPKCCYHTTFRNLVFNFVRPFAPGYDRTSKGERLDGLNASTHDVGKDLNGTENAFLSSLSAVDIYN